MTLLVLDSLVNFYPDKLNSKRITRMRNHSKILASSDLPYYKVKIVLPYPVLIEQINLRVSNNGKKQSKFSQVFQLATV